MYIYKSVIFLEYKVKATQYLFKKNELDKEARNTHWTRHYL